MQLIMPDSNHCAIIWVNLSENLNQITKDDPYWGTPSLRTTITRNGRIVSVTYIKHSVHVPINGLGIETTISDFKEKQGLKNSLIIHLGFHYEDLPAASDISGMHYFPRNLTKPSSIHQNSRFLAVHTNNPLKPVKELLFFLSLSLA